MFVWIPGQSYRNSIFILVIAILVILQSAALTNASIIVITPENEQKTIGSGLYSPIFRSTKQDWVLLFVNSTNLRQLQTLQYLIPGILKQLQFSSDSKKFVYPSIGIIDCQTCPTLCSDIGYNDLPLLVYKHTRTKPIRYRGYVTLSGFISFVKQHDPVTSYLAEWYQAEGQVIDEEDDLPRKQIRKMVKKITQMGNRIQQQVVTRQKSAQTPQNTQSENNYKQQETAVINQLGDTFQQPKIEQLIITNTTNKEESQPQQEDPENKQTQHLDSQQNQNPKASIEYKSESQSSKNSKDKEKGRKTDKKGKKVKDKVKEGEKKDQIAGFGAFIQSLTDWSVSLFQAIGFRGLVLDIIYWIVYVTCALFFGIIYIVLQVAAA